MKVMECILLAATVTLFMPILLVRPNEKMHHADPIPNLDEQQKRRLMNFYIFVSLSAGLLVP